MVKMSEPAKHLTHTEQADQQVWLSARGTLLIVALVSALPTPLSVMWGRRANADWSDFFWPVFVALIWGITLLLGQRQFLDERATRSRLERPTTVKPLFIGLLLDTVFLTACLYLGGAAHNPFTLLYFVPITLSTLLSGRAPLMIATASVGGFSLLLAKTAYFTGQGPHEQHLFLHIKGMAVALAVAGGLLTYFMRRIAYRLARQRNELSEMQRQLESDRAVTALGALAAGAAHELGSPLGTIQILAEELPHLSSEERQAAQKVILEQLARTKTILHSMLSSELSAEQIFSCESLPLSTWLSELETTIGRSSSSASIPRFSVSGLAEERAALTVSLPTPLIAQMLRELLKNAYKAQPNAACELQIELLNHQLRIIVKDNGPGMTEAELAQAREPFISFSEGRGLGLFLIDVQLRQLGGQFELKSSKKKGTRAQLTLPYHLGAHKVMP